ncbi:hypothetical protein [Guggenheimella bovis]
MARERRITKVEGGSPFLRELIALIGALIGIVLVGRVLLKLFGAGVNEYIGKLYYYTDFAVNPFKAFAKDIPVETIGGTFEPSALVTLVIVIILFQSLSNLFKGKLVTIVEEIPDEPVEPVNPETPAPVEPIPVMENPLDRFFPKKEQELWVTEDDVEDVLKCDENDVI